MRFNPLFENFHFHVEIRPFIDFLRLMNGRISKIKRVRIVSGFASTFLWREIFDGGCCDDSSEFLWCGRS